MFSVIGGILWIGPREYISQQIQDFFPFEGVQVPRGHRPRCRTPSRVMLSVSGYGSEMVALCLGAGRTMILGMTRSTILPALLLSGLALAFAPQDEGALTHGPLVGHVDSTSARIWARASAPGEYGLVVRNPRGEEVGTFHARAEQETDFTLHWTATGLPAGSRLSYEIVQASKPVASSSQLWFRTAREKAGQARIAFGSCAHDSTLR